jgi:ubiquitin-protein ligase
MSTRLVRIMSELRDFKRGKTILNAHIHFDEWNFEEVNVMIIGSSGTPYECGYFWFTFTYPDDYPSSPIKVFYHSGPNRMNPNLYTSGKVCLSLINTWGSNDWTPDNNITSVILSIQGLVLCEAPIHNEPTGMFSQRDSVVYNHFIRYFTLDYAKLFLTYKTGAPSDFVEIARASFSLSRVIDLILASAKYDCPKSMSFLINKPSVDYEVLLFEYLDSLV